MRHTGLHLLLLRCVCILYLQDAAAVQALLARLPSADAAHVQDIWDALLTARRDCEAMAARGVRVSRDISRDWQETVSDLIDRVVAQDSELAQLRQQVRAWGARAVTGWLGSVLAQWAVTQHALGGLLRASRGWHTQQDSLSVGNYASP
jgi:NADH:ubiquinone oxidoreductase subunit D